MFYPISTSKTVSNTTYFTDVSKLIDKSTVYSIVYTSRHMYTTEILNKPALAMVKRVSDMESNKRTIYASAKLAQSKNVGRFPVAKIVSMWTIRAVVCIQLVEGFPGLKL